MDKRVDGKWVPGSGPKPAALMIVGESPGRQEENHVPPKVLVGPTGQETNHFLSRVTKIPRERVYCTNMCKHVGNVNMELMGDLLREEIAEVRPKVILALGAIAVRWFLGDVDLEAVNGIPHEWNGALVVPSFHPATEFRDTTKLSWVIEAFEMAGRMVRAEHPAKPTVAPTTCIPLEEYSLRSLVAVDTESKADGTPYLITVSCQEGEAAYHFVEKGVPLHVRERLADKSTITILHNALYDIPVLRAMGVTLGNWTDTMLMASMLQVLPLGLKSLAYKLCGMKLKSYDAVVGELGCLSLVPDNEVIKYGCGDADATIRVSNKLSPRLVEWKMGPCLETDLLVMPMIIDMMENGIKLDSSHMADLDEEFTVRNICVAQEISDLAGREINPASAKQVAELFYKELKLGKGTRIKRTKWGGTTGQKTLESIKHEHPIVPMVLDWRSIDTLLDKYIRVLPRKLGRDGRIHTKLSLARVPQSGRLASSSPNLQAQPVKTEDGIKIRNGFIAEDGWELVSFDYDQIEMRVMAHESQDSTMLKIYREDGDIHTETAKEIFGVSKPDEMKHRYPAKHINFGIIYGLTPIGLSRGLMAAGLPECTEDWCEKFMVEWFKMRDGARRFIDKTKEQARRSGYVQDMWGRRVLIPEVRSMFPRTREAGLRRAQNQPMQGGAQGIIKVAMRHLWPLIEKWRGEGRRIKPLLQIHDDLLFEIKGEDVSDLAHDTKTIMEISTQLSIPTPVSVKRGKRWGSMKKHSPKPIK